MWCGRQTCFEITSASRIVLRRKGGEMDQGQCHYILVCGLPPRFRLSALWDNQHMDEGPSTSTPPAACGFDSRSRHHFLKQLPSLVPSGIGWPSNSGGVLVQWHRRFLFLWKRSEVSESGRGGGAPLAVPLARDRH